MMPGDPSGGLWRDGSFRLFFLAEAISFAGSQITRVVLPVLVFGLSGSALQTSLLLALQTTPYLVLGLYAGAIADRVNRRVLMVGFNALNGAILVVSARAASLGLMGDAMLPARTDPVMGEMLHLRSGENDESVRARSGIPATRWTTLAREP